MRRKKVLGGVVLAATLVALFVWQAKTAHGPVPGMPPPTDRADVVAVLDAAPAARVVGDAEAPRKGAPLRLSPATVEAAPDEKTGLFAGRVVNWGTGRGVEGAEVTFAWDGGTAAVSTEVGGGFRFVPPEPGEYRVITAEAEGHLPWAPEWGHSPLVLRARPGLAVKGITIYLVPAVEYHGRVVTKEGEPAGGARVRLVGGAMEMALLEIPREWESDEAGAFVFHAPDGAVLEARHPEHGAGRAVLDGAAQITHELEIRLDEEAPDGWGRGTVAGRVVDAGGRPVEGALVFTVPAPEQAERPAPGDTARTGEDGAFRLEGLDEGKILVAASHPRYTGVTVETRTGEENLVLRLGAGGVVAGRVVGPGGDAVPAFTVQAYERIGPVARRPVRATSFFDGDGRFRMTGLPPGELELEAVAHGNAPSEAVVVTVPEPPEVADGVTLTLTQGGRIVGRILGGKANGPLALARVTLEGVGGEGTSALPALLSVVSGDDGRFVLDGVPAGMHSVHVAAADHHRRIVSRIEVPEAGEVDIGRVELTPTKPGEKPQLEMAGIGAVLAAEGEGLLVKDVLPGGGAREAGLVPGDLIVSVEGRPVTELGLQGGIQLIRGPVGTYVQLTVLRQAAGPPEPLSVPRRKLLL